VTAGTEADEAGATALRGYVNHLTIATSISEIELGFGQYFGPGTGPRIHKWLVTTPVHLVSFRRIIDDAIARYEIAYGRIPSVFDAPPTMETQ
jgi:hypothetical protein